MEYQNFSSPRVWLAAMLGFGLLGLLAISYPDLMVNLHEQWTTSGELDFGYLVLTAAVTVFLRYQLTLPPWTPHPGLLALALVGGLVAFCGLWIHVQALLILGLVIAWWASMLALFGRAALLSISIVAGLLLLATPLLFLAIPLLRAMTVVVVTNTVSLFGIVVYVEGNLVHMPSGIIEIADGCSGTKYFHSAMVLALVALGFDLSNKHWLKVIGLLALVALVANWVRVFILVIWAYYNGVQDPLILDHDWLGWVVFAVAIFLALQFLTGDSQQPVAQPSSSVVGKARNSVIALVGLVAAIVVCLPYLAYQTLNASLPWEQAPFPISSEFENCVKIPLKWSHGFIGADVVQAEQFRCEHTQNTFALGSAQYLKEEQGKELVYWTNGPFDLRQWRVSERTEVGLPNGVGANEWIAQHRVNSQRAVSVFTYRVGEMTTHRRAYTKILGLLRLLPPQNAPRALVVTVNCDLNCDKARDAASVVLQSYLE